MGGTPNAALRAARERLPSRLAPGEPLSRAELADLVTTFLWESTRTRYPLDDHAVGRWERGRVRWPIAPYRSALRAVLGVDSDDALGFSPPGRISTRPRPDDRTLWTSRDVIVGDATAALEHDLITRRDALRTAAIGGAALLSPLAAWLEPLVTTVEFAERGGAFALDEVEAIEHVAGAFRGWRSAESGLGCTAVLGQLTDVSERLRHAPAGSLTDRVFTAAAELARVAGSMQFDAGAHRSAQDHYLLAARLAKAGHDPAFGAVALAALARLQFDLDAADDGLTVVRLAQRGTRTTATPRLQAMLSVREAWGLAKLGDVHRFDAAVHVAQESHEGSRTDTEPTTLARFDAAELHGTIGARYRDLARHDRRHAQKAVVHIGRALQLRGADRSRNRAFDLVSMGRVHLILDDAEQSVASIRSALPHLDPQRPGRLGRKLIEWRRESDRFRSVPDVAEIRDRIGELHQTSNGRV